MTKALVSLLEAQVRDSTLAEDTEVATRRMENHERYAGAPYGNEREGHSQHISMDVWDAVESAKAIFQEVFTGARRVLRFNPEGEGDAPAAWFAADYVYRQLFSENQGFRILRDSVHDAQVAKRCVVKVEWNEERTLVPIPMQPSSEMEFMLIAQMAQQQGVQLEVDPETRQLMQVVDESRSVVTLVQPERFFREATTYIDNAQFAGEWMDYSRGELINMGFNEDEVMDLQHEELLTRTHEDDARRRQTTGGQRFRHDSAVNEKQERVTLYTSYSYLDLSDKEFAREYPGAPSGYKLYKFYWAKGKCLSNPDTQTMWEEVDEYPYLEWTPYKISHAEHGMSDADIVTHIQRSKTTLMRLIIDNQARVNSSGFVARRNAIMNPRELLENSIGGVLWAKGSTGSLADIVTPRPQPALSAMTFAALEMLDSQKEERTGHSRLAKGLNADAVSNQNSDSMIARLTNASNRRVLRMVRDYGEELLVPLCLRLYENGRRYDKRQYQAEAQGKWTQYAPQQFRKRRSTDIDKAMTSAESMTRAAMLLQVYALLIQDTGKAGVFGQKQLHGLLDEVFELLGYRDSSRFLLNPDTPEFQQMQQAAQQQAQQQAQAQQQLQMFQMGLLKDEQQRKWAETRVNMARLTVDATDKAADNMLAQRKFDHEKRLASMTAAAQRVGERR